MNIASNEEIESAPIKYNKNYFSKVKKLKQIILKLWNYHMKKKLELKSLVESSK